MATQLVMTALLQLLSTYHLAMVDARIDTLDTLLTPGFTLTHITGYVQPRAEWLGVVRDGSFDYHRIDIDDSTLSIKQTGSSAELRGRGIFNATINGMKNPWRLQFTLHFTQTHGAWQISRAVYTTY